MSYQIVDDQGAQLGFSLKPPRWLKKAAIPLAIVGAGLLIPGAGAAVAIGAKRLARGIRPRQKMRPPGGAIGRRIMPAIPATGTPSGGSRESKRRQTAPPVVPMSAGGAPPAGGGGGGASDQGAPESSQGEANNFPLMPVLVAGALFLFLNRHK